MSARVIVAVIATPIGLSACSPGVETAKASPAEQADSAAARACVGWVDTRPADSGGTEVTVAGFRSLHEARQPVLDAAASAARLSPTSWESLYEAMTLNADVLPEQVRLALKMTALGLSSDGTLSEEKFHAFTVIRQECRKVNVAIP